MDLRSLSNSVSSVVNPNIIVTVLSSTGSTIGRGGKQTPTYADGVTGPAQLQALDSSDLRQLDGLNLQGVILAIYLRGNLAGVIRPDSTGGDLVVIAAQPNVPARLVGTYLVGKVLETWSSWTKAAIVLQNGNPNA
jgi:hypothetical protein